MVEAQHFGIVSSSWLRLFARQSLHIASMLCKCHYTVVVAKRITGLEEALETPTDIM